MRLQNFLLHQTWVKTQKTSERQLLAVYLIPAIFANLETLTGQIIPIYNRIIESLQRCVIRLDENFHTTPIILKFNVAKLCKIITNLVHYK